VKYSSIPALILAFVSFNSNGQAWVNLSDNNHLIEQNTTGLAAYSPNSVLAIGQRDLNGNPTVIYWSGNNWTTIQTPSVYGVIDDICRGEGSIYISGNMASFPGSLLAHQKVESWNGINWQILGGNDSIFSFSVGLKIFTDRNNNVYAIGLSYGDEKNIVAKWNGSSWNRLGNLLTKDNPNARTYDGIVDHNGKIYVYGNFIDANNTVFMQYWDGANWQKLKDTIMSGDIRSAVINNDNHLIISCSRYIGNQSTPFILKWDNTSWSQIGDVNPLNLYGELYSDRNDNLYCLEHPLENGSYGSHLTKLVNNQWQEFGGNSTSALNTNRRITAITLDTLNNLYAGGFYLDNPQSKYIVRFDSNADPTSVYDLKNRPIEDFVVYPNPSHGEFNIAFDENSQYTEVSICNVNGMELYRKSINRNTKVNMNVANFTKGIYILRLYKGNGFAVKKITIL
jgi:hypothetical protein